MSKQAVQAWLTLLEHLPKHRLVIFTTTEALEIGLFGNFSRPFGRRCKVLTFNNDEGLTRAFAERAKQIAQAESLDSKPLQEYVRLVRDCHNNMGAVLQRVELGEMPIEAVDQRPANPAETRGSGIDNCTNKKGKRFELGPPSRFE